MIQHRECDTCMHTYMHACIHTCMHAYYTTCMHACMHTYMHACIHTHIHAYIHTCMHTHIHTYIHSPGSHQSKNKGVTNSQTLFPGTRRDFFLCKTFGLSFSLKNTTQMTYTSTTSTRHCQKRPVYMQKRPV